MGLLCILLAIPVFVNFFSGGFIETIEKLKSVSVEAIPFLVTILGGLVVFGTHVRDTIRREHRYSYSNSSYVGMLLISMAFPLYFGLQGFLDGFPMGITGKRTPPWSVLCFSCYGGCSPLISFSTGKRK